MNFNVAAMGYNFLLGAEISAGNQGVASVQFSLNGGSEVKVVEAAAPPFRIGPPPSSGWAGLISDGNYFVEAQAFNNGGNAMVGGFCWVDFTLSNLPQGR